MIVVMAVWNRTFVLALTLVFLAFAAPAWAACSGTSPNLMAASANLTDVRDCLTAAVNGDTITVPAGSATWTSTITISTFVKLIAAGSVNSLPPVTTVTITDNSPTGTSLITVNESSAGNTKIQGFNFVQGTSVHSGTSAMILINAGGQPVLITGNVFTQGSSGDSISAHTIHGVIWHNTFTGAWVGLPGGCGPGTCSQCIGNSAALRNKASGQAATSWSTPATYGSADTTGTGHLYFEANTVSNQAEAIDCDDGCRMVVRYNTFTNSPAAGHGTDTSGIYGARYIEVYNNTFVVDQTPLASCGNLPAQPSIGVPLRGGTALIHDNIIPSRTTQAWGAKPAVQFLLWNLRLNSGGFPCWSTLTAPGAGYPFPHQAGWGYTTGATVLNGSNCANCPVHQDSEPIYLWSNTGSCTNNPNLACTTDAPCLSGGGTCSIGNYDNPVVQDYPCGIPNLSCPNCSTCPAAATFVQSGRDYFTNTAKPGYTPYQYPHPLTGGTVPAPTGQTGGTVPAPTGLTVR